MIKVPFLSFSVRRDMTTVVNGSAAAHELPILMKVHGDRLDSIALDDQGVCEIEPEGYEGNRDNRAPSLTWDAEWDRLAMAYGENADRKTLYRDEAYRNKDEMIAEAEKAIKKYAPKAEKAKAEKV